MQHLAFAALTALGYFASARLGYALAIEGGIVTLWPAAGVLLGILALSERRLWPAIVAGGVIGSATSDLYGQQGLRFALEAGLANGIESLAAAWVLRTFCGPAPTLSSLRNVLVFILGAVVLANGLTATVGALVLPGPYVRSWVVWWLGDGLGMLIVAPVILGLVAVGRGGLRVTRPALVEGLVLGGLLVASAGVALGPSYASLLSVGPYVVFPLLFWAGLRFGPAGAAVGSAVVAIFTVIHASHGHGPFAEGAASGEAIALQTYAYLFVASLAALVPAAVVEERRLATLAVDESERRYRRLFEASPQPTWLHDVETLRFLAANEAAVRQYGYSTHEFLRMKVPDIVVSDPSSSDGDPPRDSPFPSGGQTMKHRTKFGATIEVEVSSHEIQFEGRRALLVQAVDLTEQRRAEASLRAARARLQHIIASSGAVLFEMPASDRLAPLEWVSSNVTAVLGYGGEDVLAPGWWAASVHPDDRARAEEAFRSGAAPVGYTEYRLRHRDGRYLWIREERRAAAADPRHAPSLVGTWIDVTHWRELEGQFRQAQKLEAVGRLAGSVAHDFNNLLTVILGEADVMLERLAPEDRERRESLESIRDAADRAALLTRQLLLFSRRQIVAPAPLSLSAMVADLDRMLRRLIGEDVEVALRLAPDLKPTLADRNQLEQLLVNLVVNARDAMPDGGTLTVETANVDLDPLSPGVDEGSGGAHVMLAVSDTGVGMSAEVRAHLFEPFFTTKESGKGTGLGLATCHGIARDYGGHIKVYSEVGVGTTVRVYFPALPAGAAEAPPPERRAVRGGHETILLVEDDRDVRRVAARALRDLGYVVHEAGDGEEAVAFLESSPERLDLVLTDVVLPRLSGREVADRAVRARPGLRILFSSGYSADGVLRSRLLDREAVLLPKPFTLDALAHKVREVLDGPPPGRG